MIKNILFKNVLTSMLTGLVIAGLFSAALYAFATPPTSKYSFSETLNPSCTPGSANCSVESPAVYSFGSNNFSGSGSFTTTAAISGAAITGTSFIIGANTLTTSEWAFLDGQDQAVKTTSSPTFAGLTVSNLTSGRVLLASTAGLFADDSDLSFSTDTLTATKIVGTTQLTTPLVIGGTATTSDLSLQTTSGVGATGADMHFLVGNNGATEAMTILNSGYVGIGTTAPASLFHVAGQCVTGDTKLRRRRKRKSEAKVGRGPTSLPLDADEEYIYDEVQIKDIQPGDEILTLDENTSKLVWSKVNALMDMGVKPIYKLTTASGKTIRTTGNHPYLVKTNDNKSIKNKNLKNNLPFAFIDETIRYAPLPEIGVGVITVSNNHLFFNQQLRNVFLEAVNALKKEEKNFEFKFSYITENSLPYYHKLLDILEKNSDNWDFSYVFKNKSAPQWEMYVGLIRDIFNGKKNIYTVIADYLDKPKKAKYGLSSLGLIKSIANILQIESQGSVFIQMADIMLGAVSFVRGRQEDKYKTGIADRVIKILENKKGAATDPIRPTPNISHSADDNFIISYQEAVSRGEGAWRKVAGIREGQQIAVASQDGKTSVWDEIVKIEQLPAEQVYDIEVENTHNFIANGIIAHNTYISGNVGIGEVAPGSKLSVSGGATVGASYDTTAAPSNGMIIEGNVGIGTT
ncbi:MAG: Uncharacterized protein CEN87_566, partial [Parcubacteria group bacterium Licking1014_1]